MAAQRRQQRTQSERRVAVLLCYLDYEFRFDSGVPSTGDLVDALTIDEARVSRSTVNADVKALEKAGDLRYAGPPDGVGASGRRAARSYRLTPQGRVSARAAAGDSDRQGLPSAREALGRLRVGAVVGAGPAVDAELLMGESPSLAELLGLRAEDVAVQVRGTSMIEAGLHHDAFVIMRPATIDPARVGDVVVVSISPYGERLIKVLAAADDQRVVLASLPGGDPGEPSVPHLEYDAGDVRLEGKPLWVVEPFTAPMTA